MKEEALNQFADLSLRLLLRLPLNGQGRSTSGSGWQWEPFLIFAKQNVILLRVSDRINSREGDFTAPDYFNKEVALEKERIKRTVNWIGEVGRICEKENIEYIFTKAFQHYPDMGHDVDLFVGEQGRRIDDILLDRYGGNLANQGFLNRMAGKTGYNLNGLPSPLEVHHGRLGHFGEHNLYPKIIMKNKTSMEISGFSTYIPSTEDQLILQVLQRIYGHLYIRISDMLKSIEIIRSKGLGWDYILKTTRRIGIDSGLSCYLTYVDQIHRTLYGTDLLPWEIQNKISRKGWGSVRLKDGYYRFPAFKVLSRVFLKKLMSDIGSRNWGSVVKLFLGPTVLIPLIIKKFGKFRIF